MMKISEVADRLNIETYLVFEKLLTHESELSRYIIKKHGVTYLEESGLEILSHIINGQPLPMEQSVEQQQDVFENGGTNSIEEDAESDEWLTEEDLELLSAEKGRIRGEIRSMRNELIQLEAEDKRLTEVIQHYVEELDQAAQENQEVEQDFSNVVKALLTAHDREEHPEDSRLLSFLKR